MWLLARAPSIIGFAPRARNPHQPCAFDWFSHIELEPVMQEENINKIVEQTDALLISSSKVEGVGVYRPSGDRIGTIKHIMINKRTGQVAYAVMNFGGFMGLGEGGYPIAWGLLTFRELPDGYVVNLSDEELANGADRSLYLTGTLDQKWADGAASI
jgi:hypothetical protein